VLKRAIFLGIFITIIGITAGTIIGQQTTSKEPLQSIEEERIKILKEDLAKKKQRNLKSFARK